LSQRNILRLGKWFDTAWIVETHEDVAGIEQLIPSSPTKTTIAESVGNIVSDLGGGEEEELKEFLRRQAEEFLEGKKRRREEEEGERGGKKK
jgi:hypothetical protein